MKFASYHCWHILGKSVVGKSLGKNWFATGVNGTLSYGILARAVIRVG